MEKDGKTMNKTKRLAEIKRMVEQQGRIEVNDLSQIWSGTAGWRKFRV